MPKLLLGPAADDRSLAVLYRPLPAGQSRRSAKWQSAASEAFTDGSKVKADTHGLANATTHGARLMAPPSSTPTPTSRSGQTAPRPSPMPAGKDPCCSPTGTASASTGSGRQHRAHAMTTPHGASTRKGERSCALCSPSSHAAITAPLVASSTRFPGIPIGRSLLDGRPFRPS
ncbi:hypothetical protein [Streptomyces parvulus]